MYLHKNSTGRVCISKRARDIHVLGGLYTDHARIQNLHVVKLYGSTINIWFTPHYYIWYQHEEGYGGNEDSINNNNFEDVGNNEEPNHLHNEYDYP